MSDLVDILKKKLNPEQFQAVQTTQGRVLVLAGAGSGKTSVLTHRIAFLIGYHNVAPHEILGLTFTNKAASEMKQRVGKLIGSQKAKQVTLCTFHSFCMKVLREDIHHLGYTSNFSLYNEKDIKRLVSNLAKYLLDHEGDLPSLQSTLELISQARNHGASIEEVTPHSNTWHTQFAKDIYEQLHVSMRAYNAVDFDSLLSLTVRLFKENPAVLEKYASRFRYIMIDEYQDTNPIQYELATLLSSKHHNLCVVGDDDQSIYGWRGADIKHILNFSATSMIKLEQNYRSTPIILKAANAVIANNKERHRKELWSASQEGELIRLFHAPTEVEEAQAVVERIVRFRNQHKIPWKEMAILYRSNILARPLEIALMQTPWQNHEGKWIRGIPYEVFGGTEFFERSEIKDLIAYFKVIANPKDQEALLRIINLPRRGISDQTLDLLTTVNRKEKISLWEVLEQVSSTGKERYPDLAPLNDRAVEAIKHFVNLIRTSQSTFQSKPLSESAEWLIDHIQLKKAIFDDVKSDKMREFKWENVIQCIDTVKEYEEDLLKEGREDEASLVDFLSTTMLDQDKWEKSDNNVQGDKINLMTFHSSKGLEFEVCFLIGLEDHIIPHEKSVQEGGLEEERRLMYVAMTRAKKYLTLSMSRKRKRMGKDANSTPSRLLFEIPKDLLKMEDWKVFE